MKQKGSILAIDRGKKYIGCAYALEGSSVVFPIGYLLNDKGYLDNLRDIVARYRVKRIIVGMPHDEWAKKEIEKFNEGLSTLVDSADAIELFDEDYSSVQAGAQIGNFQKNVAEDTLAAMIILERRLVVHTRDDNK